MIGRSLFVVVLLVGLAAPALPCTIIGHAPTLDDIVRRADVIVRARAEGVAPSAGGVTFTILDVLKGRTSASSLDIDGSLVDGDDPNDHPVPYTFVRPAGRRGNCYALEYRAGAEYLLILKGGKKPASALTPYWSRLMPTNEQLIGGETDAWFVWMKRRLGKK
jgi:hypothetical protein